MNPYGSRRSFCAEVDPWIHEFWKVVDTPVGDDINFVDPSGWWDRFLLGFLHMSDRNAFSCQRNHMGTLLDVAKTLKFHGFTNDSSPCSEHLSIHVQKTHQITSKSRPNLSFGLPKAHITWASDPGSLTFRRKLGQFEPQERMVVEDSPHGWLLVSCYGNPMVSCWLVG